jgi:hypothetical protein
LTGFSGYSKEHDMNKRAGIVGIGAAAMAMALWGCGGGGGSGNSQTTIHGQLRSGDQTLPDGSYVDVYSCTARDDGTGRAKLKSSDFDSFLIVGEDDGNGVVHTITTDDNSGGGRDAQADFNINRDVHYFVAATNADGPGHTGSYTLDFSDNLKDVAEENNITPAVRAAAARAVQDYRARQKQTAAAPQAVPSP